MPSLNLSRALVTSWISTLLLAAGGGWWLGRQSGLHPSRTEAPVRSAQTSVDKPAPPPKPGSGPKADGPAATATDGAPVDRARSALTLTNPTRRKRAFLAFLDGMTAAQAPQVERLIFDLNRQGMDLPEEWFAFIARWGEVDPQAALAFMQAKREAGEPEGMVQSGEALIFAAWASEDPSAARRWLDTRPEGEAKQSLWGALIQAMASEDLAAATALALEKSAPNTPRQKSAMEQLSEAAVRKGGVDGMHAWFESLPEASRRDASSHVHWRNMQASMEIAAAWLTAQATTPWRKDHQIRELADRWSGTDPGAATRWAASLPPGEPGRNDFPGLQSSIGAWTAKNPEEVSAWLSAQQGQPFYDAALAGVALHYFTAGGDPETGKKWLNSISAPEWKAEILRRVSPDPAAPAFRPSAEGQ